MRVTDRAFGEQAAWHIFLVYFFYMQIPVVGVHKIVAVNERKRTVLLRFMNAAVREQKNQTGRVLNELNEHS